jgi:hypothetical protein
MFVSCKNIEPYMEGHRLTVQIGNPHSFNFGGISGRVDYGNLLEKSVELSYAGDLAAGRWTTITVVINPSKPEDLRLLWLYLSASSVAPGR